MDRTEERRQAQRLGMQEKVAAEGRGEGGVLAWGNPGAGDLPWGREKLWGPARRQEGWWSRTPSV